MAKINNRIQYYIEADDLKHREKVQSKKMFMYDDGHSNVCM